MLSARSRRRPSGSTALAQHDIDERWRVYEQMARVEHEPREEDTAASARQRGGPMTPDLRTTYLGLELRSPIVASSSPLTGDLDSLRALEEAGAAAVVLPSLFEEQIEHEAARVHQVLEQGTHSFGEALTYFPELDDYNTGPDEYLEHVGSREGRRSGSP